MQPALPLEFAANPRTFCRIVAAALGGVRTRKGKDYLIPVDRASDEGVGGDDRGQERQSDFGMNR